jgi:hypothetical protein
VPELLSMNFLMAGMMPTAMMLKMRIPAAGDPTTPSFWFVMSMALLVGFIVAYPMNWWLVANHLKHGMMTVRPASRDASAQDRDAHAGMKGMQHAEPGVQMATAERHPPWPSVPVMALVSFLALAAGMAIAL